WDRYSIAAGMKLAPCTDTTTHPEIQGFACPFVPTPSLAPTITVQPVNQTVNVGQSATFSITATGTAPLSYKWQKNGEPIAGATAASYTTPAVEQESNGSTF